VCSINNKEISMRQNNKFIFAGFLNFCFLNFQIVLGNISFVGAPLTIKSVECKNIFYKPGLIGLVQLNTSDKSNEDEIKKYDAYYLKNQNFWLDMEIIFRSIFNR
jgi:lipopolysaccharide/colanic/teichoic acid biosynthesis glycosyltransferase